MPSLKELRNRIASVKSTQKITKAMQMVAVSKLRRAQAAVEAARPYAQRVEAVLTNLAGAVEGRRRPPSADRIRIEPDPPARRLHRRARAVRRVQHRRSSAWRATRPTRFAAEGKTVKIICVGKKGYDQLRRTHEKQILELIDLRAVRTIAYETARPIAEKIIALFDSGEFDVCTLFLLALPVGDLADPDSAAAHSAGARRDEGEREGARPTTTSRTRARSWPSSCRRR